MEKGITVLQVIMPIFAAIVLGMLARRKALLTPQEVRGFQQYVMKFGLPCVVFQSCLTADLGAEALSSMALVTRVLPIPASACHWKRLRNRCQATVAR